MMKCEHGLSSGVCCVVGVSSTVLASEAKQSIGPHKERMDCFVASLIAMTANIPSRSRGAKRPKFSNSFAPSNQGAGNAGCALHPRSCAQCAQKVRAQAYRAAENIRHSLRNGFTAYNVISPVNGSFATVALCGLTQALDASTAASGPHVFAVRLGPARLRDLSVHRNLPLVRDDRERPSEWDRMNAI